VAPPNLNGKDLDHWLTFLDRFSLSRDDLRMKTKTFFKMMSSTIAAILLPALFLSSCATYPPNPNIPELSPEGDYYSAVAAASQKRQVYDGLYEILEINAVLVNSKVAAGRVDQNARMYQWTREQYNKEKADMQTDLSKQTEIILGFFVPSRKEDNLAKKTSVWKIFLDVNGHRYEGQATKIKALPAEVRALYPDHVRFYTPYKIEFPVPISMVENAEAKFTVTGPVASATLDFPPSK